jgi:acyl transferase domain-containing protein
LKDGLRVILRHAARWREFTGAAVAANLAADNVAPCVLKPRTDFEAESLLKDIDVHPATLPAISLHTGKEIVKLADTGTQMRNAESEMSGLEALVSKRQVTFLQMGAQSTDAKMLAQCLREYHRDEAVLASLDYDSPARETMLKAASVLYTQGRGLEWGNIAHESSGKLVRLPLYPFQRERYWLDEEGETDLASAQSGQARAGTHTHPLPGRHSQFAHFPGHHFWELELDPQGLEKLLRAQPADGENPHAAIFAEMARAAASEVFGMRMWLVQEVELKSVLPVRAGETRMIQTTLISGQSGEATFHIHSCRAEPQDSWLWHVTGKLRAVERQTDADGIDHSQGLEARLAATRPTREVILAAADADERRRLLEVFLREQIARSLDAAPSRLDIELPLSYLGLDSLLAVEIKQNIESSLGATLPLALLLQDANIVQLADELAQRLSSATNAPAASTSAPGDDETASLMAKLDELSDDEVERLLGQMMTEEEITE